MAVEAAPSNDVQDDYSADIDAADLFYKNLTGEDYDPSTERNPADRDADGETQEEEDLEEGSEGAGKDAGKDQKDPEEGSKESTETAKDRRQAADDDEVVVQVGEESKRVSVKDLKRLFGQEASLTQKSQQLAETRKAVDTEAQRYNAGLQKMSKEATDRWNEYQKIDYLIAKDAMQPQEFLRLRQDAQAAYEASQFYGQELGSFQAQEKTRQSTQLQEAAKEAVKAIQDPTNKSHIEGWNQQVYNDLRSFAVTEMGAPADVVNQLVDPWAIKVIHMAMTHHKAVKETAVVPKPVKTVKAAPKVTLTNRESPNDTGKGGGKKSAMERLQRTGDVDDAAAAFLQGWGVEK